MSEILVKEYRGDIVENIHRGSIAIVSSTGDVIAHIGDIENQTYMRSASKPIQILPTLLEGLHERYGLSTEEVAIMNSSHWGSTHHIYTLKSIAEKTGINPEFMVMKECSGTATSALASKLLEGGKLRPEIGKSKLHHCCAGKHFGLMLLQREYTGNIHDYHKIDSPVQKQILSFISMLSQTPAYKISLGVDGCGVPVFALPMRSIAQAYAKLADPFSASKEFSSIIEFNWNCITKHPEKINDYYTPSYYINQNPDLLMKDGSRGLICMAIKSRKLGIVVKLEDGWSDEFQGIIIANILEQLRYEDTELIEKLKTVYKTKIYNDCNEAVGYSMTDFNLNIDEAYFDELEKIKEAEAAAKVKPVREEQNETPAFLKTIKNATSANASKQPYVQNPLSQFRNDEDEIDAIVDAEERKRPAWNPRYDDDIDTDLENIIEAAEEKKQAMDRNERASIEERNRHSLLGMATVLPSKGPGTVIKNPMTDSTDSAK